METSFGTWFRSVSDGSLVIAWLMDVSDSCVGSETDMVADALYVLDPIDASGKVFPVSKGRFRVRLSLLVNIFLLISKIEGLFGRA